MEELTARSSNHLTAGSHCQTQWDAPVRPQVLQRARESRRETHWPTSFCPELRRLLRRRCLGCPRTVLTLLRACTGTTSNGTWRIPGEFEVVPVHARNSVNTVLGQPK